MDYGMIGKIEKAKRYAEERNRMQFTEFTVDFKGENGTYRVTFADGKWHCTCNFFKTRNVCSHSMALERILAGMIPSPAQTGIQHETPQAEATEA